MKKLTLGIAICKSRWFMEYYNKNVEIIIYSDGTQFYYKSGLLHRKNGPAIIFSDGSKRFYKNGSMIDGEIIINSNGNGT